MSHAGITRFLWAALAVVCVLGYSRTAWAEEPVTTNAQTRPFGDAQGNQETPLRLEDVIRESVSKLTNASSPTEEHWALLELFGDTHLLRRANLPSKVQEMLIARGLNYSFWESRVTAVNNLAGWFDIDGNIPALIAVLGDGLNDPHPGVRKEAADGLSRALDIVAGGHYVPKDEADKARFGQSRQAWADAIVDLAITKALTDEDPNVLPHAWQVLADAKPNLTRLRSLERVLAKKVLSPGEQEQAEEVRAKWAKALQHNSP
jgi:hypothetical protein